MFFKKVFILTLLLLPLAGHAEQNNKQHRYVNVTVNIDKALMPKDAEDWVLYVYAAKPNTRLPLANFKGKLTQLPLKVKLDESMYLLPHLTLKQSEEIFVMAKATKSTNPHEKSSNDLVGYSKPVSFANNPHLAIDVTIDQRDKLAK